MSGSLDKVDIAKDLEQCPREISDATDKEIQAFLDFKNAEIERKNEFSRVLLEIAVKNINQKSEKGKGKLKDEMKAEAEQEMYTRDMKLIELEATWKRAQNNKQFWRDTFASAKYRAKLVTNDSGMNL